MKMTGEIIQETLWQVDLGNEGFAEISRERFCYKWTYYRPDGVTPLKTGKARCLLDAMEACEAIRAWLKFNYCEWQGIKF